VRFCLGGSSVSVFSLAVEAFKGLADGAQHCGSHVLSATSGAGPGPIPGPAAGPAGIGGAGSGAPRSSGSGASEYWDSLERIRNDFSDIWNDPSTADRMFSTGQDYLGVWATRYFGWKNPPGVRVPITVMVDSAPAIRDSVLAANEAKRHSDRNRAAEGITDDSGYEEATEAETARKRAKWIRDNAKKASE
jgi:hypothetical protein